VLPLPTVEDVKIVWPSTYSWSRAGRRLEPIKRELSRLIPVELYDSSGCDWHKNGGFPVPEVGLSSIGKPLKPKGQNDIRGEIFEVHVGKIIIRCAYDYSDYPLVSEDILRQVDVYFKKSILSDVPIPSKVVSLGFYAKNPRLLAKARSIVLKGSPKKKFDVYGRFGAWTDSQTYRQALVDHLRNNAVNFTGGFGTIIYPAYLKELMQTRIALDVPGQAPASPRMVEAMALGALVMCGKPACVFPEQIIDGVHYIAFREDMSNVVELCQALLEDEERRQKITRQAMLFFDRNFSPQSMARRVIRCAVEAARVQ
jgi:glycosyltransferase involved in cell wall biosynthesis